VLNGCFSGSAACPARPAALRAHSPGPEPRGEGIAPKAGPSSAEGPTGSVCRGCRLVARAAVGLGWAEYCGGKRRVTSRAVSAGRIESRRVVPTGADLGGEALTAELVINRRLAHGRIP
jgi:hypothetical protein